MSSATATVAACGALTTVSPRDLAASKSILSTPTPARPITLRFELACSSTSAVTLVRPRIMSASLSPSASSVSDSTTSACSRSSRSPSSDRPSVTNTRQAMVRTRLLYTPPRVGLAMNSCSEDRAGTRPNETTYDPARQRSAHIANTASQNQATPKDWCQSPTHHRSEDF